MKQVTLFSHLLLETKNAASTIKMNSFDVDFISIVGLLVFFLQILFMKVCWFLQISSLILHHKIKPQRGRKRTEESGIKARPKYQHPSDVHVHHTDVIENPHTSVYNKYTGVK